MDKNQDAVPLQVLKRWLLAELTRVDASFREGQLLAQTALGRDLIPGEERIAAPFLEISELTLGFTLSPVREGLWVRSWRSLRQLLGHETERPLQTRYRLAPRGRSGIKVECLLRRGKDGEFNATLSSAKGGELA